MKNKVRWLWRIVPVFSGLLLLACCGAIARAGDYPDRPIKLIVPLAPGGPTDVAARIFAKALSDELGQNVFVENIAGAAGVLGTAAAVKAEPDGYTLLLGSISTFAVTPAVMTNLRFDVAKDLNLIALIAQTEHVLGVRPELGINSLADLFKKAKEPSSKLNYASSGTGGILHLAGELINFEAGTKIVHVPFRGGGPAVVGVMSGDADMCTNDIGVMMPLIKAGKLTALAVASPKRSTLMPDVPTFAELGYPGIVSRSWYGLAASAKAPAAVLAKLTAATVKINDTSDFHQALGKAGLQPIVMTAPETAEFVASDLKKWKAVAKAADIRLTE